MIMKITLMIRAIKIIRITKDPRDKSCSPRTTRKRVHWRAWKAARDLGKLLGLKQEEVNRRASMDAKAALEAHGFATQKARE